MTDVPRNPNASRGWGSIPAAELDGTAWPLSLAAELLGISRPGLLRELILELGIEPCGTLNMREYRSQGRAAKAYRARDLILIGECLRDLREKIFPDSPDKI